MRLTSRAFLDTPSGEPAHVKLATLGGLQPRADRAHRRPGRSARSRDRGRPDRACGGALRASHRDLRRPAVCRIAAARAAGGKAGRSRAARSRLYEQPADCRRKRAVLRAARGLRGTRRAHLHRRRAHHRRDRAAPAFDRALLQVARRNGGAVRRSARGFGLDGRDRAALRVPAEDAQADPAALYRRGWLGRGRSGGVAPPGRRRADAPRRDARPRVGPDHRRLPRAARFRARRHRADEISRLLPDRRGLHPVGQVTAAFRSGRAAARARARLSPMRSPSRTSIRSASGCCSSASSIRNACRCRTSISTSARIGATR